MLSDLKQDADNGLTTYVQSTSPGVDFGANRPR